MVGARQALPKGQGPLPQFQGFSRLPQALLGLSQVHQDGDHLVVAFAYRGFQHLEGALQGRQRCLVLRHGQKAVAHASQAAGGIDRIRSQQTLANGQRSLSSAQRLSVLVEPRMSRTQHHGSFGHLQALLTMNLHCKVDGPVGGFSRGPVLPRGQQVLRLFQPFLQRLWRA